MASDGAQEREAARTVRAFLESFRRRSLALSLLRLCFVAVAVNECVRWLTLALNAAYRLRLPVMSPGPVLLVVLFAGLLRRWSLPAAARRADAALSFSDRFVSFLDFAARTDVPAPFRKAQVAEAAAALGSLGPRTIPACRWYLALGPVLLLASTVYPIFLAGAPRPATWVALRHPPGGPAGTGQGERGRAAAPAGSPEAGAPGTPQQQQQGAAAPEPRIDPTLPTLPDGSLANPKEGDPARSAVNDVPPRDGSALKSFQVGQSLSRVVDPLAAPAGASGRREIAAGAMTFRLLPTTDKKGGAGGAAASAGAQGQAVVDIGAVPERYRGVVERYFTLLNAGT